MGNNLKNYLRFLRIKDWRGYFLTALFGFMISKWFLFPLKEIIIFWIIIILFLAFGFSVNDCFDTKEDKLQKYKKNSIVTKEISLKKGLFFSISLAILGLALSIRFGLEVFILSLVAILLAFFYSAPPFRLKSKPFLDLLSHGLFAGTLIFFFPILVFNKNLEPLHYLIGFSIFYLSVIAELRNHLEDYEFDKKAGLKTTVCVLGYKNSENLLRYLVILSPLTIFPIFLLNSQKYLLLFLILSSIFLFFALFNRNYQIVKNYKMVDIYIILSFGLLTIAII